MGSLPFVPGVYTPNSTIAELILKAGQERARSQERLGQTISDSLLNIGNAAQQGFAQRQRTQNEQKIQGAVSRGIASPDSFETALQALPPEIRTQARKEYSDASDAAARIAERHAKTAQEKVLTQAAQRKFEQDNLDDLGTIADRAMRHATDNDGGLSGLLGAQHAMKANGVPHAENFDAPLQDLVANWQKAVASNDPAQIKAAADQNRAAAKAVFDPIMMRVSPEHMKTLATEQPAGVSLAEGASLVNPRTGAVMAQGAPKKETRTVDEQLAAAQLAGDQKTVATLLGVKRQAALASHVTDPSQKLVKVEHKDSTTGHTVIEWLPQSEVKGKTYEKGTSGTVEARLASAEAVNQTGTDIISKLKDPAYAKVVGPAMGRLGKVRDWIGDPPPELAELAGLIESYSLANMGVHGMRSVQGSEKINKLLDSHHTPESLIAAINGLQGFSTHFMQNEGRGAKGPGAAAFKVGGYTVEVVP